MFFIASKLFAFVLSPIAWMIMGFLLFWKGPEKNKKWFGIATLLLLLFFTNPWIHNKVFNQYQFPPSDLPKKNYSYGIVLGGFQRFDIENNRAYLNGSAERFYQAARLLHNKKIERLIISGGSGITADTKLREADVAAQAFQSIGLPDSLIIKERQSRNTYENLLYCKTILTGLGTSDSVLLITSSYHLPRALAICKKLNIPAVPYSCGYVAVQQPLTQLSNIIPNSQCLENWDTLIKEWVGIIIYKITGKA